MSDKKVFAIITVIVRAKTYFAFSENRVWFMYWRGTAS